MLPPGFSKVITHYAGNGKAPIRFSDLKELVGDQNFDENKEFILQNNLAKLENLTKDICDECGDSADVKDVDKGIVVCRKSHLTNRDPLALIQFIPDEESLLQLFFKFITKSIELSQFSRESAKYSPFHICGYEQLGLMNLDEIQVLFLVAFKRIKLKDAAMLQGLITTTVFDSFVLLAEDIEEDAEKFLSYSASGAIQYVKFDSLLNPDSDLDALFKSIQSEINIKVIKLHSFLKKNLNNVKKTVSPEMFHSMLEYDAKLIERSFKAATSGSSDEFEDIVANLLGAFMPVTNLGHAIASQADGKKIEAPDGVIEIPEKDNLELMFYDCKSVGTATKEKETKLISQPDEDQFERYCKLFTSPKLKARLSRGIFIANDFSLINLANKSLQIRAKSGVPSDLQIVYFPLKSLVKLYSRLTQERSKFMMHFESEAITKLFGQGITHIEEEKLKSDENFKVFDTLRKSNTNSVYIIESLVDVFFDYVYSFAPRNHNYLPYIIDISKRQSARY